MSETPITRQDLRDLCRRRLGDLSVPYHFSDLQINQWINDALADISQRLPRLLETELTTLVGLHAYDLPTGLRAVVRVEYSAGQDPPALLSRLERAASDFYHSPRFYDVQKSGSAEASRLWLSADPAGAETIWVTYQAEHDSLDDDSDVTSLPERHLELVMLYVRWAAYQELASGESMDPDPTSLALGTLELNAYRAQCLYLTALNDACLVESESAVIGWGEGRVY